MNDDFSRPCLTMNDDLSRQSPTMNDDFDALFAPPEGATVDFLEDTARLEPGVDAEVIDVVPGMGLLATFRRFGVVLDLGPDDDEVEYKIALC